MQLVLEYTKVVATSFGRVYVYPLCRDVQRRLTQDSAPRWIPGIRGRGVMVNGSTSQKGEPLIKELLQRCDA